MDWKSSSQDACLFKDSEQRHEGQTTEDEPPRRAVFFVPLCLCGEILWRWDGCAASCSRCGPGKRPHCYLRVCCFAACILFESQRPQRGKRGHRAAVLQTGYSLCPRSGPLPDYPSVATSMFVAMIRTDLKRGGREDRGEQGGFPRKPGKPPRAPRAPRFKGSGFGSRWRGAVKEVGQNMAAGGGLISSFTPKLLPPCWGDWK